MELQVAGPGVQHGGHAELHVEAVAAQGQQGLRRRLEQQAVDELLVAQRHRPQLARQREDDVEVMDRQDPLHPPLDLLLLGITHLRLP
jgi:hypothetical protein